MQIDDVSDLQTFCEPCGGVHREGECEASFPIERVLSPNISESFALDRIAETFRRRRHSPADVAAVHCLAEIREILGSTGRKVSA